MTAIPGRQNDEEQVRHPIVLKRISAPTDLNPDGKKAVEYAVALAEHFGARLTLQENAQNALDSFRSEIGKEYPRTDTRLRCGVPAEEIVSVA